MLWQSKGKKVILAWMVIFSNRFCGLCCVLPNVVSVLCMVCVCVCVRERERERVCVVCVCVCVCERERGREYVRMKEWYYSNGPSCVIYLIYFGRSELFWCVLKKDAVAFQLKTMCSM